LRARGCASVTVLAAGLALASAACVSPDVFLRDAGDQPGAEGGGTGTAGATGAGSGGSGNGTAGSKGSGGHITTGAGGTVVTGSGGRTGTAGATGTGGAVVIGPTANYMDGFETGDVNQRWLAPQSSDSTPCGTWTVAADGATNHVYSQTSTACTSSNPSLAAGGNTSWTDMRLQVRVRFDSVPSTSGTKITIAVRYNDPKNMYFIEYTSDGKIKIRERTSSSTTDVNSLASKMAVPVPVGTWSTIGLGIKGSTINAYLGTDPTAAPVVTGTAAGQTAGGIAIGIADGTASFDDVLVTPP
jgi:hypothetical protein